MKRQASATSAPAPALAGAAPQPGLQAGEGAGPARVLLQPSNMCFPAFLILFSSLYPLAAFRGGSSGLVRLVRAHRSWVSVAGRVRRPALRGEGRAETGREHSALRER